MPITLSRVASVALGHIACASQHTVTLYTPPHKKKINVIDVQMHTNVK